MPHPCPTLPARAHLKLERLDQTRLELVTQMLPRLALASEHDARPQALLPMVGGSMELASELEAAVQRMYRGGAENGRGGRWADVRARDAGGAAWEQATPCATGRR